MKEDSVHTKHAKPGRLKLVVFFNHRFEKNIPRLRDYYQARFPKLRFICPFYRGSDSDVSAVYDSSARFQNFFVQARSDYLDDECSHYVFIGDDLILNPALNESNLLRELRLDGQTAFISCLQAAHKMPFVYQHLMPALHAVGGNVFVNHKPELPDYDAALEHFARHGFELGYFTHNNLRYHGDRWKRFPGLWSALKLVARHRAKRILDLLRHKQSRPSIPSYPMLYGNSDFVVVPHAAMKDFLHYCGVFAAMNLFVEFALPTALLFACERVKTIKDTAYQPGDLFDEQRKHFAEQYGYDFNVLLREFSPNVLYYHPVKLSQWK